MNYSINLDSKDIAKMDEQSLQELKNMAIHLLDDCLNAVANKNEVYTKQTT